MQITPYGDDIGDSIDDPTINAEDAGRNSTLSKQSQASSKKIRLKPPIPKFDSPLKVS